MKANPLPENYRVEERRVRHEGQEIYGQTRYDEENLIINPKKGDVVNTIIHEKLHANYPDMDHEKIYENAAKIEGAMTLPEMAQDLMIIHLASQAPDKNPVKITYTGEVPKVIKREIGLPAQAGRNPHTLQKVSG